MIAFKSYAHSRKKTKKSKFTKLDRTVAYFMLISKDYSANNCMQEIGFCDTIKHQMRWSLQFNKA